jgi:protein farnesyltransferase subunit beta
MDEEPIFEENDLVAPVHPIYVIPQKTVDGIRSYFSAKQGF